MKNQIIIVAAIIFLLVIANAIAMNSNIDCSYSNNKGSFTFEEMNSKERTFEMCQRKFNEFKKQSKDTVLYRLCSKNYLKFWNWGVYFFQDKYKLPYKQWKEIERQRGAITAKSGFQDF